MSLDKVNQALAMFGKEAVPGKRRKPNLGIVFSVYLISTLQVFSQKQMPYFIIFVYPLSRNGAA